MELILEDRDQRDKTLLVGNLAMTPPIDESYWEYRVKLHKDQAIVAFPKFFTIGVGFAQEEDWNTNLPYSCDAEEIADHIWHNHKYDEITRDMVVSAIKLIQEVIK